MSVIVADTGTGDRYLGVRRGQKVHLLPGRPVMRNLENIGTQVGTAGQDRLLSRWLNITGEQQPDAPNLHRHNQARVVLDR